MRSIDLVGPSRIVVADTRPPDACRPGEVVLRTLVAGLCGSDGPFFRGELSRWVPGDAPPRPGFPIHEVVGTVVESRCSGLAVGQTVVGWAAGMDGGADLVTADGSGLHAYQSEIAPRVAILLQPLACVIYVLERLGDVAGRRCAVVGLGPIGLLFAHVLKSRGAAVVTGVDPAPRGDAAAALGLDPPVRQRSSRWGPAPSRALTVRRCSSKQWGIRSEL